MRVSDVGRYELLGETVDDAAGEAFDKCAKTLCLGYPGGPALARLAARGDAKASQLPRPLMHSPTLDFSFAGLKTAVWTLHRKLGPLPGDPLLADIAAATQAAIVDVLVSKSERALQETGLNRMVVAGGVGANSLLRERLNTMGARRRVRVHYPDLDLCTDNGAMIALAGAMRVQRGIAPQNPHYAFDVLPRWSLADIDLS
jgi:N6-L-threonylcarbamoyladenine synthase